MAFAHIREGKTFTETAIAVRVKLRTLMNWVKQFKKEGLEGLKDKPGRGAKPFLREEHRLAFRQAVLELQEDRKGGRIRRSDVLELMKTKYGVSPSLRTVYDTLKRIALISSSIIGISISCRILNLSSGERAHATLSRMEIYIMCSIIQQTILIDTLASYSFKFN